MYLGDPRTKKLSFFFEIGHYLLSIYSETNLLFCDNFRVYQRCPSPKNKTNNKERVETMHQPLEVKNYDGYDNRNSNDDDFDINIIHGGALSSKNSAWIISACMGQSWKIVEYCRLLNNFSATDVEGMDACACRSELSHILFKWSIVLNINTFS